MIGGVLPAVLSDFFNMELRDAYAITGWSFGAWYSLGILSILFFIRERPATKSKTSTSQESPPLVREMLRIYRNQAFGPWMMAYILDYAAIGIVATMVPIFSQYVLVQPDSTDCKQQCHDWNPSQTNCTCAKLATEWLGWLMAATFLSAMLSVPFWHWLAGRCKKHTAWLIYSWWNALTSPFYIVCGKGSLWLTAVISAVNGSAFGGQFIGESVMADLSDYDEFLYGDRAEGMLAVIATLGPKMVLVVCFVIPLATVAAAGFRDSVWPETTLQNKAAGLRVCEESEYLEACPKLPQPQNDTVIIITRLGVSIVPTVLGCISNFFKWRFPLKRKEQMDEILLGIDAHKQGQPAKDPISGCMVETIEPVDQNQRQQMWALEMWGAAVGGEQRYLWEVVNQHSYDERYQSQTEAPNEIINAKSWRVLQARAVRLLAVGVIVFTAAVVSTASCFHMLEKESTSWVPTSLCVCSGSALVFTIVCILRLKAARQLSRWEVPLQFVKSMLCRAACTDASAVGEAEAWSSVGADAPTAPQPSASVQSEEPKETLTSTLSPPSSLSSQKEPAPLTS